MDNTSNELKAEFIFADADIFSLDVDMIINPVNCKGVSGAGLALSFKRRFPVSQRRYENVCKQELFSNDATGTRRKTAAFRPGDILHFIDIDLQNPGLVEMASRIENGELDSLEKEELEKLISLRKHLVYFPTKNHWKRPSKYEYIEKGMWALRDLLQKPDIDVKSLAIPALGCGLGTLDPRRVSEIIIANLWDLPVKIYMLSPLLQP